MKIILKTTLMLCLASALVHLPAGAQEWSPSKPIRLIVPITGTTNDILARLVAPKLSEVLGQPVVVETRAGAGGLIGSNFVAKAEPDGHTLLVGNIGPLSISPNLIKKMPFDPLKDLTPITLAMKGAQYVAVNPASGIRSIQELVQKAKDNPGKYAYSSVGVGSSSQLTMEMLKIATGIDLIHVPYKGAEAVTALISQDVLTGVFVPGNVQEFAKEGRVRLLASTGRTRFASSPDVPTMMELGYGNFEAVVWGGFLAPGGTPKNIVDRLNKELVKIIKSPDVSDRLRQIEYEVVTSTPQEFAIWMRDEIEKWGKIVKATGIQPD